MSSQNPFISVVSPVYRAEGMVAELVRRITANVETITPHFEIILVEDGSPDKSWEEIAEQSSINPRVKGIKLSRNFGQHYAITAGLDFAKGEWVIVMDCDLQDRPEEIPALFAKATTGFDIVLARRKQRKDGYFKKMSSRFFYAVLSYLTGTEQDSSVANFGIYHKKVIDAVKLLREPVRYFPTMIKWVGFKKSYIDIEHGERLSGATSYNWLKLTRLAFDIILANSDKPIRLIIRLGFLIALFSFLFGVLIIVRYMLGYIKVPGYASLLVSVWFIGGIMMLVLGIIGLYVGKIFEAVKSRPIYVVDKMNNL